MKRPEEKPTGQSIRIMCPNLTCRKVLAVPAIARGKTVRCKTCGTNIRIPQERQNVPDDTGSDAVA